MKTATTISDLFPAAGDVLTLAPADKSELLGLLADEASRRLNRPREDILDALQARERLGPTALGRGVAMPHTRLPGLDTQLALLARLSRPIDFEARDGEPVDLVFLILWPEAASEGFLPALANVCRVLRNNQLPRQLRQARSPAEALAMLQATDQD
ncbi:PTS sugar transporter subunit IIA [Roseomonas haemaphysalidis]|uniref:PTS sugar transporter subunit IIA n=1 Tax=Roseomonas haemaphysalidis TaxID=2768162 RepID=UPI001F238889|nr:PTS sugar transporter subunit IIA [Roseomonas haemaphysalidis]